jgi:hypothetical protein
MTQTYGSPDPKGAAVGQKITQGGYATAIVVDQNYVVTIPDSIPLDAAAPLRPGPAPSLFASAPLLTVQDLAADEISRLFPGPRRHEEHDDAGTLLSFFHGDAAHTVLRAKEAAVMRPHGHLLRSGQHAVPDETALTSTVWMAGVFHSLVTQGHVGINQCLSTVRGALGQFRAHGQRIFIDAGQGWQLLGVPSAFEMRPEACRWLYRHAGGLLEVRSGVCHAPHALTLDVQVLEGGPLRLRLGHHVTLGGDDGVGPVALFALRAEGRGVFVGVPAGSALVATRDGAHRRTVIGRETFQRDGPCTQRSPSRLRPSGRTPVGR